MDGLLTANLLNLDPSKSVLVHIGALAGAPCDVGKDRAVRVGPRGRRPVERELAAGCNGGVARARNGVPVAVDVGCLVLGGRDKAAVEVLGVPRGNAGHGEAVDPVVVVLEEEALLAAAIGGPAGDQTVG